MKKIINIMIVVFLFVACTNSPVHISEVNKIIDDFSFKLNKSEDCQLFGRGGAFIDDIKKIDLTYIFNEKANVNDSRVTMVKSVEELLTMVNSSLDARNYLHNYPFNSKNIDLGFIYTDKKNNFYFDNPSMASVSLISGNIYYDIYDFNNKCLKTVYQESYEEALKIIKKHNEI